MPWKLSLALVFALAWLPASSVRAEEPGEEPATGQAAEPEAAAESEEPAQAEETAAAEEPEEADDSSDDGAERFDRDGWYLGLGGGYTKELFNDGNSGDGGFLQIRAGYHFLRFVALEPQFEYSPKFKGKSGRYAGVNTATWATWLNLKGYPTAPWTWRFQPFAMIGIAWMWERRTGSAINGSEEEGGFASRYGAGIDIYVTEHVMITTEAAYVLPAGSLSDLNQVQIGGALQYRF